LVTPQKREEIMRNRWFFLSMALLGVCLLLPQKSQAQSTISCSSDDERRHSCAADTRGGVRLASQHSGAPCTEGYSWGSDNQGVWVDHGCRADFTVGGNRDYRNDEDRNANRNDQYGAGNAQSQSIACSSDDERKHTCAMDTRGGVRLLKQHSGAACTEGYSWGTDYQGVWVDHGCRADFSSGGNSYFRDDNRNDQNRRSGREQTIACSSDNMRRHSCALDTQGGGVRVVRQFSDAPCTRGYSWGTNRRGIWVDHGCRADFAVIAKHDRESWR
jgi:hypothetical protein